MDKKSTSKTSKNHCQIFKLKDENLLNNFILFSFFVWVALVVWLKPCADDWYYLTAPNCYFNWVQMLPQNSFWRPLDALYGALLGFFPSLFPWLNHILVVFGHVFGCFLTVKILRYYYQFDYFSTSIAAVFFLFSAGGFAAVASIDSLNQVYSQLFAIIAFYFYIKYKEGNKKCCSLYLGLCILSTFSKESGIVWGVLIPLLYHFKSFTSYRFASIKSIFFKVIKDELLYIGIAVVYLIARLMLGGAVAVGEDSRYAISFSVTKIVKNIVLLLGGAWSSIDTVALLLKPTNIILVALTALFNLGFLLCIVFCIFRKLFKKEERTLVITLLLLMLVCSLPNILTTVGEMHIYALWFLVTLMIAYLFNKIPKCRIRNIVLACFALFMIASIITVCHKWMCMFNYGEQSLVVTEQIREDYRDEDPPENVLIISVHNEADGYSIYMQPVAAASSYGMSSKEIWDWEYPISIRSKSFGSMQEADLYLSSVDITGYDSVWLIESNGTYERVK